MDLFINNDLTTEITQYLNHYDIVNLALTSKNSLCLLNLLKQNELKDLIKSEIHKLHHTYFSRNFNGNQHTVLLKRFIDKLYSMEYIRELLFYAVEYECTIAINYLLQKPYVDINKLYNNINDSLLILACKNNSFPIFNLLLDYGANITYKNRGFTPLKCCFYNNFNKFISLVNHQSFQKLDNEIKNKLLTELLI